MAKFDRTKAAQGALNIGAQGAFIGNMLKKKYGNKAIGIGSGIGAGVGFALGGLQGTPDPDLGARAYEGVYDSVRADTMRQAREASRAVGDQVQNYLARRGISSSDAAVGIQAANQGRIFGQAQRALIPLDTDMRLRAAQDRLEAQRVGEYEKRQGFAGALTAAGVTAMNAASILSADHETELLEEKLRKEKVLPQGFLEMDAASQGAYLRGKGIMIPPGWDTMTPEQRNAFIKGAGLIMPHGPYLPAESTAPATTETRPTQTSKASQESAGIPNQGQVQQGTAQGAAQAPAQDQGGMHYGPEQRAQQEAELARRAGQVTPTITPSIRNMSNTSGSPGVMGDQIKNAIFNIPPEYIKPDGTFDQERYHRDNVKNPIFEIPPEYIKADGTFDQERYHRDHVKPMASQGGAGTSPTSAPQTIEEARAIMNSLADTGQTRRGKGYAINEYGGHFEVKPRPGEIAHGVKSGNLRDRRTGEMRPIRNNQEFWMGLSVPWALYSDANLEQWRSRHQKDVDDGHIEQSFLDAEYAHLKKWRETIKIRGEQKQYLESVGRTLPEYSGSAGTAKPSASAPADGWKGEPPVSQQRIHRFPTPGVEPVDPYMALPRAEPDNRPRINARRSDGLSPPEDVQGTEPVPQLKQVAPRPQPGFDGTVEPPATQRRIHRFPTPGVEPVDPYMALPAAQPDGRPRINARAEHGLSPPEDVQGFDRVPESLPSVAEPPAKATGVPGIDMLKVHEGFRATPYRDTEGKLTVGFGRNLDDNPLTPAERAHLGLGPNDPLTRITQEQAEYLFNNDLMSASNSAMNIFGDAWNNLNDARKSVIVNMIYNMGAGDFREFQDMIKAVKEGDWNKAAQEMLVNSAGTGPSDWAKTVGQRAQELAEIMRTGRMPGESVADANLRQSTQFRGQLDQSEQQYLEEQAKTPTTSAELAQWQRNTPMAMQAVFANPNSGLAKALLAPHTGHVFASAFAKMGDAQAAEAIAAYNSVPGEQSDFA